MTSAKLSYKQNPMQHYHSNTLIKYSVVEINFSPKMEISKGYIR